ncbi:MAG: hypothetical protein LBS62_00275 [Clostridiales bacterium]|nr:hypothetical protein [Clostridiales bacterium]
MALISCPNCSEDISDSFVECPFCQYELVARAEAAGLGARAGLGGHARPDRRAGLSGRVEPSIRPALSVVGRETAPDTAGKENSSPSAAIDWYALMMRPYTWWLTLSLLSFIVAAFIYLYAKSVYGNDENMRYAMRFAVAGGFFAVLYYLARIFERVERICVYLRKNK